MTHKQASKIQEALYRAPNPATFAEIWAVDFYGTICTNKYPRIGEPNIAFIKRLRQAQRDGVGLILRACRTGTPLKEAIEFCALQGLVFDAATENLPCIRERFGADVRKVYANRYIDDRAEKT